MSDDARTLALSNVAWEGNDTWEAGFELLTPAHLIDHPSKRWLVDAGCIIDNPSDAIRLVNDPIDDGATRIPVDELAKVLVRCRGVIALADMPLAWDAWRAGKAVFSPDHKKVVLQSEVNPSLWAGCVPPFLASWDNFWRTWDGKTVVCTAEIFMEARKFSMSSGEQSKMNSDLLVRRMLKLFRHPRAFMQDSSYRILRYIGSINR